MTNILFVCKYNRFRSKVAEAYFNKLNKDKSIHVRSAGLIKGDPSGKEIIREGKKFGFVMKNSTRSLSESLFRWSDIIINVASDVPSSAFSQAKKHGVKIIMWNVADQKDTLTSQNKIIKIIMKKVEKFVREFN